MGLQPWMYLVGSLMILAVFAGAWFFIGRTPMRYLILVVVRYRLRRFADWIKTVGQGELKRYFMMSVHSYEELFDTMLVIQSIDSFHLNEVGLKWTDIIAEDGKSIAEDLADLYLSFPLDTLSFVSQRLFVNRFRVDTNPEEILQFLLEERQKMQQDPTCSLEHPKRLWNRFGFGPIYGWRTPLFFSNGA